MCTALVLRRAVLMIVAFAYLFTGLVSHSECAHALTVSQSTVVAVSDGVSDTNKSLLTACDHCPTCSTALVPDMVKALLDPKPAPTVALKIVMVSISGAGPDSPPPKDLI